MFTNAVGEDWHTGGLVFHHYHVVPCQTVHAPTHCALNAHRRTWTITYYLPNIWAVWTQRLFQFHISTVSLVPNSSLFKNSIIKKYKTELWPPAWFMDWIFYLYIENFLCCFSLNLLSLYIWGQFTDWKLTRKQLVHNFNFSKLQNQQSMFFFSFRRIITLAILDNLTIPLRDSCLDFTISVNVSSFNLNQHLDALQADRSIDLNSETLCVFKILWLIRGSWQFTLWGDLFAVGHPL